MRFAFRFLLFSLNYFPIFCFFFFVFVFLLFFRLLKKPTTFWYIWECVFFHRFFVNWSKINLIYICFFQDLLKPFIRSDFYRYKINKFYCICVFFSYFFRFFFFNFIFTLLRCARELLSFYIKTFSSLNWLAHNLREVTYNKKKTIQRKLYFGWDRRRVGERC